MLCVESKFIIAFLEIYKNLHTPADPDVNPIRVQCVATEPPAQLAPQEQSSFIHPCPHRCRRSAGDWEGLRWHFSKGIPSYFV